MRKFLLAVPNAITPESRSTLLIGSGIAVLLVLKFGPIKAIRLSEIFVVIAKTFSYPTTFVKSITGAEFAFGMIMKIVVAKRTKHLLISFSCIAQSKILR